MSSFAQGQVLLANSRCITQHTTCSVACHEHSTRFDSRPLRAAVLHIIAEEDDSHTLPALILLTQWLHSNCYTKKRLLHNRQTSVVSAAVSIASKYINSMWLATRTPPCLLNPGRLLSDLVSSHALVALVLMRYKNSRSIKLFAYSVISNNQCWDQ